MPRYRFQWSNLPDELLLSLGRFFDFSGSREDVVVGLRSKFGSRPSPDFVKTTWEFLRDNWLSRDTDSLTAIAADLREAGVGDVDIDEDFQYVCSCRNAKGLREIVLRVFIDLGEASSDAPQFDLDGRDDGPVLRGGHRIGTASNAGEDRPAPKPSTETPSGSSRIGAGAKDTGRASSEPSPDARSDSSRIGSGTGRRLGAERVDPEQHPSSGGQEISTRSSGELRSWLCEELRRALEDDAIVPDPDGSFTLTSGSAVISVSILTKPSRIEVASQLVSDVESSEDLLRTLNHINGRLHFGKVHHHESEKAVRMSSQFLAAGLGGKDLRSALSAFVNEANHFDTEIADMFGGTLTNIDDFHDEQLI